MSNLMLNLGVMGLNVQGEKLAAIGNNIANSRTAGYKNETVSFAEEFSVQRGSFSNGVSRQSGNGVVIAERNKDWSRGVIEGTSNVANLAINGDGMLPVSHQGETLFTRAGDFSIIEDAANPGTFVMQRPNGAALLGATSQDGDPAGAVTFSSFPDFFSVDSGTGEITARDANNQSVVTNEFIAIHRFANPDSLVGVESGMYQNVGNATRIDASGSTLLNGSLELSNVDLAKEFTDLIVTQRAYSANTRTIRTADEMLQEIINLKR